MKTMYWCQYFLVLLLGTSATMATAADKWPSATEGNGLPAAYTHAAAAPTTQWPPKGTSQTFYHTQDDILSLYGNEKFTNSGQSNRIKLKGRQEITVFDADLSALKGKIVTGALWHVTTASPEVPFKRVGVSSMATPWKEGSSKSMYKRVEGEVSYSQAELEKRDWAYPGSNVLDVIFGLGNTTWKYADFSRPDNKGRHHVAVDPKVIAARIAGISHGFAVYDEIGNEWSDKNNTFTWNVFPNRFAYSRHERKDRQPYLQVWTNGTDNQKPNSVVYSKVNTAGFRPGQALIKWITPKDNGAAGVIGFNVRYTDSTGKSGAIPRYLIPMATKVGAECRMHIQDLPFKSGETITIAISAVDAAGNESDPFTRKVTLSSAKDIITLTEGPKSFAPSTTLPSVGGLKVGVIDALDKITPVDGTLIPKQPKGYMGGNHLFNGKTIRLYSAKNEFVWFQLVLQGTASDITVSASFKNGIQSELFEYAYVGSKHGNVPDVMMPLTGATSIPSKVGQVHMDKQRFHTIACEVYVPHGTNAGKSTHAITVTVGDKTLTLPIELNVWDFTLPNTLSFISEMNSYNFNLKNNYELHRIAHKYRLVLNQLPYGWSGNSAWPMKWTGNDFDNWSWFDKNIGPLLDGSAFKGLPRGEVPTPVLYTPFNENWPIRVKGNYRADYWADTAFTKSYIDNNKKAYAAMAKHIDKKGYHDTFIEFYLNNKIYYRNTNTDAMAPWILDEPNNTQDFWALRYYGILWHQAVGPVKGKAKMIYRTDISYPEHGRETMWGVCDRLVMGGAHPNKIRQKQDEWNLWHENYLANYGAANDVHEPNTQPAAWSLLTWVQGGTGVLPWQTMARDKNWKTGSKTGLFYPHDSGYKASIRLKAFTRGQQDIEYLTWYKTLYNADHFAVAKALEQEVGLKAKILKSSETDAGKIKFAQASPQRMWNFRVKVGQAISKKKPAFKAALTEWEVPPADMNNLPDIGHTAVAPKVKPYGPVIDSFEMRRNKK